MSARRYLPEGLVEGCTVKRSVQRDSVLTYDDVDLPKNRLADRLRAEQYRYFRGETWLDELLTPDTVDATAEAVNWKHAGAF